MTMQKVKPRYHIKKYSEVGYQVIDTSTNECLWDVANGCCVFTLDECRTVIDKELERNKAYE